MVAYITKAFVLFGVCVFIFHSGLSKILVIKNNGSSSSINTNVVKILNTCFQKNLNPLIATDDISYQFRQHSSLDRVIPLIIVDKDFQSQKGYRHYPKLATFALSVNSVKETENILLTLKSSIWWNIDSVFLLVGSDSCDEALAILNSAWQEKLLSAIFLCHYDPYSTVMMYTYNPFTNRAPSPWVIVDDTEMLENTWTLYKRRFKNDKNLCENLVYDKLKYMDGYYLKAIVPVTFNSTRKLNQDYNLSAFNDEHPKNEVEFFHNFFSVWNFTVKINFFVKFNQSYNYDFVLSHTKTMYYENAVLSYPLRQTFMTILTKKRLFLTPAEKIMSFYNFRAILLIFALFGTIIIALILNKRQRFSSAFLEITRLIVASSVRQPLRNQPIRIYFFGIFWFFLIFNATFTGNLVKFLTKPERTSIESLSDLQNFNKVFIHPVFYELQKDELLPINKSIRFFKTTDDFGIILNNSQVALVMSSQYAYKIGLKYQLHVSKPFNYYYTIPGVSLHFPFLKQINDFTLRWFNSGLQKFWDNEDMYRSKEKLSNIEAKETEFHVRPITLSDLSFAFKFLIFGLACSFVVFVMEIAS